jgi:glucose-1-phosphate cytidylyltransferase
MKVVILAGGLGTRLSEETDKIPKPMVEIGGMPILWHIMKGYAAFGHREFVIACGYKGHIIKRFFADYWREHAGDFVVNTRTGDMENISRVAEDWDVQCVDTGAAALTGDRVLALRDVIGKDEDFMLTYGDGVSDVDVKALIETHHAHGRLVTLTAARPKGRFGALDLEGGIAGLALVTSFREKLDEGWVNAGFMVLSRRIFDAGYLPGEGGVLEQAMHRLAKDDHLAAYLHEGYWQTMDTLREKHELESAWQKGGAPWTKYWKRP